MKFKEGDWLAWNDTIARVSRLISIDGNDYYRLCNGVSWPVREPSIVRVHVTFPKPKHKLTLSAGLAWLKAHPNLALTAHVVPASSWGIWDFQLAPDSDGYRWIVRDCETPLKAIIAARKALDVK